jgi:hypothetical protein
VTTRSLALTDQLDVDADKRRHLIGYLFDKRKGFKRVAPSADEGHSCLQL